MPADWPIVDAAFDGVKRTYCVYRVKLGTNAARRQ
jgi:hypothetical protein